MKTSRIFNFRAYWADTRKAIPDFLEQYLVEALNADEFIIQESTGFFDKEGTEIFEGDVLQTKACLSSPYERRVNNHSNTQRTVRRSDRDHKLHLFQNSNKQYPASGIGLNTITAKRFLVIGNVINDK